MLSSWPKVAVAYSGGVDSTFLLAVAAEELGANAIALTVRSPFVPRSELESATAFCEERGIRQVIMDVDPLEDETIRANSPNRCYLCKALLFRQMGCVADDLGYDVVVDGSNADDKEDYRPGMQALQEAGIVSPLLEVGLTKQDIRYLSQQLGLPTWDKPSMACLASRIPYDTVLDARTLRTVEAAEQCLARLGFDQVRVRVHGDLARVEVASEALEQMLASEVRMALVSHLKELGFCYVCLDLEGYRVGSMNEALGER